MVIIKWEKIMLMFCIFTNANDWCIHSFITLNCQIINVTFHAIFLDKRCFIGFLHWHQLLLLFNFCFEQLHEICFWFIYPCYIYLNLLHLFIICKLLTIYNINIQTKNCRLKQNMIFVSVILIEYSDSSIII